MSKDETIKNTALDVIRTEISAAEKLLERIDEDFINATKLIAETKGRVIISGVGKSGLIARKIVATMNSTGTPAIFLHPVDALHGDLGIVRKEDVAILISKSGGTEELHDLILMLKRIEVPIIALCGNKASFLGRNANYFLNIHVNEEACPYDLAPTSSTTVTLMLGDALAISLLKIKGFTPDDFAALHPAGNLGKKLTLKVEEIMIGGEDLPKVHLNTPFRETVLEITQKRLGTTTVVDDENILRGIITDGDLRRLIQKADDLRYYTAEQMMTKNPKTIRKENLASNAISIMEKYNITTLVVTNEKREPIGIVHLHDLVKLGFEISK
jgi:arabinose-5-phosphate isomerase